jgi:hypothetical protein
MAIVTLVQKDIKPQQVSGDGVVESLETLLESAKAGQSLEDWIASNINRQITANIQRF